MEETVKYEAAYIVLPVPKSVPVDALPPDDPDMVAYNECRIAIHMAESMLAGMRHHLGIIQQRIINKTNNNNENRKP